MTTTPTARAYLFASIGFVAVASGIAFSSPEIVGLGAPFLVLLTAGLAGRREPHVKVESPRDELRGIEGARADISLVVNSRETVGRAEIQLGLPPPLSLGTVVPPSVRHDDDTIEISADGEVLAELDCHRWGVYELDTTALLTRGVLGLSYQRAPISDPPLVKVFPNDETARRLLEPIETQLAYGDLVARQRGPGIEYADMREMRIGDDPRHINWRASARSPVMWVNDRHPERNSDVVLLIDTFPEARRGVEHTLDLAVRAVAGLAKMHLRRHDRVGLITFGEPVRWLQPGMGARQRYRILDALMGARRSQRLYWRGISAVPRQALPSKALIVALTPLLDDRIVAAVADLQGRGLDVAVVEVPAEQLVDEPENETDALARRIWELRRESVRRRFSSHGVAIAVWDPTEPFERALMEVDEFRRFVARARA